LSKEIVTTNTCAETIACAVLVWTARSQGSPLAFRQNLLLQRFVRQSAPISAPNLSDGGYAQAICDEK
jgi:hypothetical protein